ncbi:MAG: tRNA 4-thiouridine(8) synthase ThiI [Bacilli bacterium]|nr:tRNA 4-thiouridine(8) synthase ThiI [Bacilli bacterium]
MQEIIMLKYGELSTKKANINFFLKTLKNNINKKLKDYNCNVLYDKGRMYVTNIDSNIDEIIEKLQTIFGIHELVVGYSYNELDFNKIKDIVLELVNTKAFNTFKVQTKRSNKKYPLDSMEISRSVGAHLLKNISNIKVDVHNPDLLINLEIHKDSVVVYFDTYKGIGGYPVGTLGKGLLMLSGGIDSPVAGYLAIKRGVNIHALYFESPPHTSIEAKNKVIELARKLANYNNGIVHLHVINFTNIQEEIYKKAPNDYLITLMRRCMYRISEGVLKRINGQILINGESIGQVASQTLTSMNCINKVVSTPVIRPVACFDKNEIIDIAKKIDTYEISILPFEDCCTIFVPEHPVINPSEEKCIEYEKLYDYESMVKECIFNHEIIKVEETKENKFEDLL